MALPDPFRALVLENSSGTVRAAIKELPLGSLPEGEVSRFHCVFEPELQGRACRHQSGQDRTPASQW